MKTQTPDYSYAIEKITNTLECLTTHPGNVRERIAAAFLLFHTVTVKHLPEKCGEDWRWVMSEIHKYEPGLDYKGDVTAGSVEYTMKQIRKVTAVRIAKKICKVYWAVSQNKKYL